MPYELRNSSTFFAETRELRGSRALASDHDDWAVAASRRTPVHVETDRNADGEIRCVRIGAWRTVSSGPQRRLVEVRRLDDVRVAVRLERLADGDYASSEIWQLYHVDGRLEAAMQSAPDGSFAVLTNYQTRQACRLVRGASGQLESVESWEI